MTLLLKGEAVTVGSHALSDLLVDDPTVSRLHAVFRRVGHSWSLKDLASTNGTWVNGRQIASGVDTALSTGDHIALGGARFFFDDGINSPQMVATGPSVFGQELRSIGPQDEALPERLLALSPYEFEKLTGELFTKLGFESLVTQQTADGGVDVVAINNGVIFRGKYLVQCKRYNPKNKVSLPALHAFFGRVSAERGAKGIFVTSSSFTRGAKLFAESNGINLIDGQELERLILRHHLL